MSVTINGTGNTITPVTVNTTGSVNGITPQASNMQPFNRIINGAMTIDQRNAGASINPSSGTPTFCVDRFICYQENTSKLTFQQNAGSVTPPVGFTNYLGATSSSAYTPTVNQIFGIYQPIEGYNFADLGFGTANAKSVTISFQVYSSLTGTFGGALKNSGGSRSYAFSYSIPTANTWTSISVTIAGDTSGTWLTTNGIGANVCWGLGIGATYSGTAGAWAGTNYFSATGATSIVGTSGATFYITGVQLEAGSSASSFAHENYSDTLQKCQRYAKKYDGQMIGISRDGNYLYESSLQYVVEMRASPTLESGATYTVSAGSAGTPTFATINNQAVYLYNGSGNWTASQVIRLNAVFNAEL